MGRRGGETNMKIYNLHSENEIPIVEYVAEYTAVVHWEIKYPQINILFRKYSRLKQNTVFESKKKSLEAVNYRI